MIELISGRRALAGSSSITKRSKVQGDHGFVIVGIRRDDGATLINPPTDTTLLAGDIVVVLGHDDEMPQLAGCFCTKGRKVS